MEKGGERGTSLRPDGNSHPPTPGDETSGYTHPLGRGVVETGSSLSSLQGPAWPSDGGSGPGYLCSPCG